MGRNRTNPSRNFFKYEKLQNRSICNICNTVMTGNHGANLERHLKRYHNDVYENVQLKRQRFDVKEEPTASTSSNSDIDFDLDTTFQRSDFLNVKLNKDTIIKACIELITVNGCSFKLLESTGFKKILNPIVRAIDNDFRINSEFIKSLLPEAASKIIAQINTILQNRLISLKIDQVTRQNGSIMVIRAQLIINGEIKLYTLAKSDLKYPEAVKKTFEEIFGKYIDFQQVYCIITGGCSEINTTNVERTNPNRALQSGGKITQCVTCVWRLLIVDFLNKPNLSSFLDDIRELVNKLQTPSLTSIFEENDVKRPVLDCKGRWNTTYAMLRSLLKCKHVCSTLSENDPQYCLPANEWIELGLIVDTLKFLIDANEKSQSNNLTLSDFFGIWIETKIKIQNLENQHANTLYGQLSHREICLLENRLLLGAIYLDPRYQILLTPLQKGLAVEHLKNTWNKLESLEKRSNTNETLSTSKNQTSNVEVDDLEMFLRSKELEVNTRTNISLDIEFLLNSFNNIKRLERTKNILEYWEDNKYTNPHLYKLAMVVFSVPSTQVSANTTLSDLDFILEHNKDDLSEKTLEDLIIIRNNFDLFQ